MKATSDLHSVTLLTQYYPPEFGAPQARLHEMMRRLAAEGINVEVITAMPNYPVGKIFPEYRGRLLVREEIDGVKVLRVPIFPSGSSRIASRLLSYFSFTLSSLAFASFMAKRNDVLIYESPPLFLGMSARPLSWILRSRLVMNVSDLWPESIVRLGALEGGWRLRALQWLERSLYRSADLIIGQSSGIVSAIQNIVPDRQVELLSNGCDCNVFNPDQKDRGEIAKLGWEHKIVVGYAGLIGLAQGIDVFLRVARAMKSNDTFRFMLVGGGPEFDKLRAEAIADNLTNLVFLGPRPKRDMPSLVAAFDIALVPLRTFIPGALPSKLYEIMASAVPVVLCAEGDPAELVRRAECGEIVDYEDTDAIAFALSQLADDPEVRRRVGMSGRAYATTHHDRNMLADRLRALLEDVVAR